jgi:hypothetical protein
MAQDESLRERRASLVATDELIGLQASLAASRAEVQRLQRRVRRLEAKLAEKPAPASPTGVSGVRRLLGRARRVARRMARR